MHEMVMVSDGLMLTSYLDARWMEGQKQYTRTQAPEKATAANLRSRMGGPRGGILLGILSSDFPLEQLAKNAEKEMKVSHEKLDGTPVSVVEMTVPLSSLVEYGVPYGHNRMRQSRCGSRLTRTIT